MLRIVPWLVVAVFFALPSVAFAEEETTRATGTAAPEYELMGLTLSPKLITGIKPNRMGLSYADEPKQGVLVREVFKNSQAAKGGFLPDDIIYRFDGDEIDSVDGLIEDMIDARIGGVPVRVLRKVPDPEDPKKMKEDVVALRFNIGDQYINRINLLIFDYSRTKYFKHYNVLFFLWQYKRSRNCQYTKVIPILYQYRRISTRVTHRIFWFFKIQTGKVPEGIDL